MPAGASVNSKTKQNMPGKGSGSFHQCLKIPKEEHGIISAPQSSEECVYQKKKRVRGEGRRAWRRAKSYSGHSKAGTNAPGREMLGEFHKQSLVQ